jgi:hypothetical protein
MSRTPLVASASAVAAFPIVLGFLVPWAVTRSSSDVELGTARRSGLPVRASVDGPNLTVEAVDFLRFVETGRKEGRLETAVAEYTRVDGVSVALVGAVHVGDPEYYDEIETFAASCDSFLYELIADPERFHSARDPSARGGDESAVTGFQRILESGLGLEFQLDGIDYRRPNFVHADMRPDEFFAASDAKGEGIFTFLWKSVRAQVASGGGLGSGLNAGSLLGAWVSRDRERSLKYVLAREFDRVDGMLDGIEAQGDSGTVLLGERNRVAIETLEREIARGQRRLAIFYGAGHMPDLERRILARGFRLGAVRWLCAWRIGEKRSVEPTRESSGESGSGGDSR